MFLSYLTPTNKISQSCRIFRFAGESGEKLGLIFSFRVQSTQSNQPTQSPVNLLHRRRTPSQPSRALRPSISLLCLLRLLLTFISFLQLKWSFRGQRRSRRNLKRSMKLKNILGNQRRFIRAISQIKEKILTLWSGRVLLLRKYHREKLKTINRENP